jgi:TonB family protein
MMLVRDMKHTRSDQQLQLILVDSAQGISWKAFATGKEVRTLLRTVEDLVARAPAPRPPTDSTVVTDDQEAGVEPAVQLEVPQPAYPLSSSSRYRDGRVWAEYVVGVEGRVEQGSIRILLADHARFAKAAAWAMERARFRPATRWGRPVRQRVFQPVSFRVRP